MPNEAQVRRDIRAAVAERGLKLPWLEEILDVVRFSVVSTATDAASYAWLGHTIKLREGEYYKDGKWFLRDEGFLHQLLHELWHAWYDEMVEERETDMAKQAKRRFRHTQRGLEAREVIGFHRGPAAADDFRESGSIYDSKASRMADEMWGDYIQKVLNRVVVISSQARCPDEAQLMWDDYVRENGTTTALPSDYLRDDGHVRGRYEMGRDVGRYIRENLLGIGARVGSWPQHYRGWERRRFSPAQMEALRGSGAMTMNQDRQRVLERFVRILIEREPQLREGYRKLGMPKVMVGPAWDVKTGGGHVVMVVPLGLTAQSLGDPVPIDVAGVQAGLTALLSRR